MTVLGIAVAAAALLLMVGVVGVGQAFGARLTAAAAADAAALAAAPVTFRPFGAEGDAASEARRFAERNGAELVSCRCRHDGSYASRQVVVTVRVDVDLVSVWPIAIEATSVAEFRPIDALFSAESLHPLDAWARTVEGWKGET